MAGRKQPWSARLTGWGNRMILGGERVIYIQARITDPESQDGRVINIEITPKLAAILADRLDRNIQEIEEHNARDAARARSDG